MDTERSEKVQTTHSLKAFASVALCQEQEVNPCTVFARLVLSTSVANSLQTFEVGFNCVPDQQANSFSCVKAGATPGVKTEDKITIGQPRNATFSLQPGPS